MTAPYAPSDVSAVREPSARITELGWRRRRVDFLLLCGLLLWSLAIQAPWRAVPLPVTDMGVFLKLLQDAPGTVAGASILMDYVAADGRFVPGTMLVVSAKVRALGPDGADWRWASFVLSFALVVAAYGALRRFAVIPVAAFAGAALFIYADHASPAWVFPQVMEPIAALFIIAATAIAARYRTTPSPLRDAILISLCLVAAIWIKEPVIAAAPFVLAVALCWRDGMWDVRPPRNRVHAILGTATLMILVLNIAPILAVRLTAAEPDYASRYSLSTLSPETASNALRAALLPVTRVPWFPANLAAAAIVTVGVWFAGRTRGWKQATLMMVCPLILPLAIGLIYAPWPAFPGFYALPGTFGLALLLGAAITSVFAGSKPIVKGGVIAAYGLLALLGTMLVSSAVAGYTAERTLEWRVASHLKDASASVLAYGTRFPERSGAYGRSLLMYVGVYHTGLPLRSALDVSCPTAGRLATALPRDTIVIAYRAECPELHPLRGTILHELVSTRDWKTLRPTLDTISATISRPAVRVCGSRGCDPNEAGDLAGQ
jgi:hypothetical protein